MNQPTPKPPPVVDANWLLDRIDSSAIRVVDVRGTSAGPGKGVGRYRPLRDDYLEAHIPGAYFLDWTDDIIETDGEVPFQIAAPDKYAQTMRRLGIDQDTLVVAYDTYYNSLATRFAWTLRYYGHEQNTVLNGGFEAWKAAGGQVTSVVPKPLDHGFEPRPQAGLRYTAEQMLAELDHSPVVIDGRAHAEYVGESSRAERYGHVPGAHNLPFKDVVDEQGRYWPADELAERFRRAGVEPKELHDREVIVYCNGGVTATSIATALVLAGGPQAAVYDGSWNEWGNLSDVPIETGERSDSPEEDH